MSNDYAGISALARQRIVGKGTLSKQATAKKKMRDPARVLKLSDAVPTITHVRASDTSSLFLIVVCHRIVLVDALVHRAAAALVLVDRPARAPARPFLPPLRLRLGLAWR